MHLLEIFIPQAAISKQGLADLKSLLVREFGGLTAYTRSPAEGFDVENGETVADDIIILEVMTATLDRTWWHSLRVQLTLDLKQHEVLIRASNVQLL